MSTVYHNTENVMSGLSNIGVIVIFPLSKSRSDFGRKFAPRRTEGARIFLFCRSIHHVIIHIPARVILSVCVFVCLCVQDLQVTVFGISTPNFGIRTVSGVGRSIFLDFLKKIVFRKKIFKKPPKMAKNSVFPY